MEAEMTRIWVIRRVWVKARKVKMEILR